MGMSTLRSLVCLPTNYLQNMTRAHNPTITLPNTISEVTQPNHGRHHLTPRHILSAGELDTCGAPVIIGPCSVSRMVTVVGPGRVEKDVSTQFDCAQIVMPWASPQSDCAQIVIP